MTAGKIATYIVFVLGALAITLAGGSSVRADSIGVAPTSFDFENLVRGESYSRSINVWHDSENERSFSFVVSGDIAPWVHFFDLETGETIETLVIPWEGIRSGSAAGMTVSIPEDAANGFYGGEIRVSAIAADPTGGASAATVGAVLNVFADVSGVQNLTGQIRDASAISIESGVPVRFDFRISNDGNVQLTPNFEVTIIDADGNVAHTASGEVEPVGPGEIVGRTLEVDSDRLRVGDYTATVTGSYRNLVLGETNISFSVLERGTLSRSGNITRIALQNEPIVGEIARLRVEFQNTGEIEANAIFEGQVFLDGELVEVITSLPKLVTAGNIDSLDLFFDIESEGEYTVSGKVNFDGKESQVVELNYSAGDQALGGGTGTEGEGSGDTGSPSDSGGGSTGTIVTILVIVIVVGALIGGGFVGYRRGWRIPARRRTHTDAA